jgi:hypothetical protein
MSASSVQASLPSATSGSPRPGAPAGPPDRWQVTVPGSTYSAPRVPPARGTFGRGRIARLELVLAFAIGLVSAAWIVTSIIEYALRWSEVAPSFASDYDVVIGAAARWLAGGPYYLPEQLAGPYAWPGPWVLYPPPSVLLFAPFIWLPALLWWAIPVGLTAWAVVIHRPRPLAYAAILFCLANPTTQSSLFWGNPGIWLVAALAVGTHRAWPSVLVLLKPTLLPFALIGAWRRAWWLGLAGLALVSVAFLPMWFDYVTVIGNARGPSGWFGYSTAQIPMMLIPVAAWLGRRPRSVDPRERLGAVPDP